MKYSKKRILLASLSFFTFFSLVGTGFAAFHFSTKTEESIEATLIVEPWVQLGILEISSTGEPLYLNQQDIGFSPLFEGFTITYTFDSSSAGSISHEQYTNLQFSYSISIPKGLTDFFTPSGYYQSDDTADTTLVIYSYRPIAFTKPHEITENEDKYYRVDTFFYPKFGYLEGRNPITKERLLELKNVLDQNESTLVLKVEVIDTTRSA